MKNHYLVMPFGFVIFYILLLIKISTENSLCSFVFTKIRRYKYTEKKKKK